MELRHLRYFVALAGTLNFRRAAERLGITTPSLSRQIRDLEHELNVELLSRTQHGVELTEAGKMFLEDGKLALAQADRCAVVGRMANRGEKSEINIGYETGIAFSILPRVLSVFRECCPNVAVVLHRQSTGQQIESLGERRIDVGLLRLPVDAKWLKKKKLYAGKTDRCSL